MKKNLHNGLKPIPESKMSPEARIASQAHPRATKKKRADTSSPRFADDYLEGRKSSGSSCLDSEM
jgi:hypothetical protein